MKRGQERAEESQWSSVDAVGILIRQFRCVYLCKEEALLTLRQPCLQRDDPIPQSIMYEAALLLSVSDTCTNTLVHTNTSRHSGDITLGQHTQTHAISHTPPGDPHYLLILYYLHRTALGGCLLCFWVRRCVRNNPTLHLPACCSLLAISNEKHTSRNQQRDDVHLCRCLCRIFPPLVCSVLTVALVGPEGVLPTAFSFNLDNKHVIF